MNPLKISKKTVKLGGFIRYEPFSWKFFGYVIFFFEYVYDFIYPTLSVAYKRVSGQRNAGDGTLTD